MREADRKPCVEKCKGMGPYPTIALTLVLNYPHSVLAAASVCDRLERVEGEPRLRSPAKAAEAALIRGFEALPAQEIIPVRPRSKRSMRILGMVRKYAAAIVSKEGMTERWFTTAGFVPCSGVGEHQCVAVRGDPCRKSKNGDCEGMYLLVSVDVTKDF
jgi:hypothetical protein